MHIETNEEAATAVAAMDSRMRSRIGASMMDLPMKTKMTSAGAVSNKRKCFDDAKAVVMS